MPAITRLCERALLLDAGALVQDGPAHQVVATYLHSGLGTTAAREWSDPALAPGSSVVRLLAVRIKSEAGAIVDSIDIRQPVGVELDYEVLTPGYVLLPHYTVHNAQGVLAFTALDQDPIWRGRPRPAGRYRSTGWIPGNLLSEGVMLIGPAMRSLGPDSLHFWEKNAVAFQVVDCPPGASTARGDFPGGLPGAVRPLLRWSTEAGGQDFRVGPALTATSGGRG
jgi:lipopolysaccharide transport system ATP-binding protein